MLSSDSDVRPRWDYAWEQVLEEVNLEPQAELPQEVSAALAWVAERDQVEVNRARERMINQIESADRTMRSNGNLLL